MAAHRYSIGLVLSACLGAGSFRVEPPTPPLEKHIDWGVDLSEVKFDGDYAILPNGTRVRVADVGNGELWDDELGPFSGMKIERAMREDGFVCHNGRLFGIRIPGKRRSRDVFSYVTRLPMPNLEPIEVYYDNADERRQFVLFPPVDDWSKDWRMVYRRRASMLTDNWAEQHLYSAGLEKPCGDEADEENKEEAQEKAAPEADNAGDAPDVDDAKMGAQDMKPAQARGLTLEKGYGPLALGIDPTAKTGPGATEALRGLLSGGWRPSDFGVAPFGPGEEKDDR